MARTNIPVQTIPANGGDDADLTFTAGDASNHHDMEHGGGEVILIMENASGGAIEITITAIANEFGRAQDVVQSVAAGDTAWFGPFLPPHFESEAGKIYFQVDGATSLTFAAVRFSPREA